VILDVHYSRDALKRVYAGSGRVRSLITGVGSFLAVGSVWEVVAANKKGNNVLTVYQQPPYLSSANLLSKVGLKADNLADDFIFVTTQKVLLISFAAIMYTRFIWPLMVAKKGKTS